MMKEGKFSIGLDFGTESVRALIVGLDGSEAGVGVSRYEHGQILEQLPTGESLPPASALQHPEDWLRSATTAVQQAVEQAGCAPDAIVGIGVDFTSCTVLPTLSDGTPLCLVDGFERKPHAWPKLWKHHGAGEQADRITAVAKQRGEAFLDRYGGVIGLEWFFPKVLEVIDRAPDVHDATEVWLEAGDWFVWRVTNVGVDELARSACQAGYKAMWSAEEGYPSEAFFNAVDPRLADVVRTKLPGRVVAPGDRAGVLSDAMAEEWGLTPGIPVSAATIDAHAGVPGAGAAGAGSLVMVVGTSSCHMLNAESAASVPGVAGVVKDGILPGYYGYETGQAAVGDAFDWARRLGGFDDHEQIGAQAAELPPGAEGVLCIDWLNGCRTPLMDGSLHGAFLGLTLRHTAAHLYRASLEASAYGLRWIVECLEAKGVEVNDCIATGGLPHHNPGLMQIYADVLDRTIKVHPSTQGPALGAAVLGAIAAGGEATGFDGTTDAIDAMAGDGSAYGRGETRVFQPDASRVEAYRAPYAEYRRVAGLLAKRD